MILLYRQNHKKKHTDTHTQKEKKENIYVYNKKRKRKQITNIRNEREDVTTDPMEIKKK